MPGGDLEDSADHPDRAPLSQLGEHDPSGKELTPIVRDEARPNSRPNWKMPPAEVWDELSAGGVAYAEALQQFAWKAAAGHISKRPHS